MDWRQLNITRIFFLTDLRFGILLQFWWGAYKITFPGQRFWYFNQGTDSPLTFVFLCTNGAVRSALKLRNWFCPNSTIVISCFLGTSLIRLAQSLGTSIFAVVVFLVFFNRSMKRVSLHVSVSGLKKFEVNYFQMASAVLNLGKNISAK